jgi:hypothetical protein
MRTDLMQAERLIGEASNIINRIEQIRKESGVYFNIFSITERENFEESTHCRFLYELLSPEGSHYQSDLFLRLFFNDVLKEDYPSSYVHVEREKKITNDSRLDLYIETSEKLYLIEVKIYAGEQDNQIERYCQWAASKAGKKYQAYFLTLDGYLPSTAGEYREEVKTLSFEGDILNWLDHCKCKVDQIAALREAIEQYRQLLIKITGKGNDNMKELKQLIFNNIEVAYEIDKHLPYVKGEMMKQIFDDIKEHIDSTYELECVDNCYKDKCEKYYLPERGGSYPCVSYKLGDEQNAYCQTLRIEVADNLYFGGSIYFKKEGKWEQKECNEGKEGKCEDDCLELFNDLKNKYQSLSREKPTKYYFWWKYIEVNGGKLNFKKYARNYFQLYKKDGYEKAIREILEQIDDVMYELGKSKV